MKDKKTSKKTVRLLKWIGNVLLIVLNVPLIGIWVKLLRVPYRFLFPSALFFIAVGVYSVNNSLFEVSEVLVFGLVGAMFSALEFSVAPILLGYVLGPMIEVNFRRALLLSRGDLAVFLQHPISCAFLVLCAAVIAAQLFFAWTRAARKMTPRVNETAQRRIDPEQEAPQP